MIGSIRGTIVRKQPPWLLVDVGGVGYEIEAPMSTFYRLPDIGDIVHLHTHLAVREDAHTLFGFSSEAERAAFRQLIKVSGVGARLAVTILSGVDVRELVRCIREDDVQQLTRLPGIGKKTAQRLVVDLKDRLNDLGLGVAQSRDAIGSVPRDNAAADALSALEALGYRPQEAKAALQKIVNQDQSSEALIRAALQVLVKR